MTPRARFAMWWRLVRILGPKPEGPTPPALDAALAALKARRLAEFARRPPGQVIAMQRARRSDLDALTPVPPERR